MGHEPSPRCVLMPMSVHDTSAGSYKQAINRQDKYK